MKKLNLLLLGLVLAVAASAANAFTFTGTWAAYTPPAGATVTMHAYCGVGTATLLDIGTAASTAGTMPLTITAAGGTTVNCVLHAVATGYLDGLSLPASVVVTTPTLPAPTAFSVF